MDDKKSTITFDPGTIEPRWQKGWEKADLYATPKAPKNKKYILDMFPYPSGATLHVGHVEGYVGTDILSRFERMRGSDVLHPMGWDAFGLPAENYAIKTGIHPDQSTHNNIKTFKRQLRNTGLSYDWDREIDTSSPEFYKWTQWLFILMYKRGLAYKKLANVNWCPSCETVLANEQVVEGRCERCSTLVAQKKLSQWFLKITQYADRLISGLEKIDWPESVKIQQKNWIGRKEGIEMEYPIENTESSVKVFTTRPDTNFGATFVVLAPEHPLTLKIASKEQYQVIQDYITTSQNKSAEERKMEGRKKTGMFTGAYAINNLNGARMPIWVSDFVLTDFGTGAVVGVPGHDVRDFEFAKEFDLPIIRVVVGKDGDTSKIIDVKQVQEEEGTMVNSEFLNGMEIHKAKEKIMDYLEEKRWGKRQITYHLRDWLISRQRYWGAPIPMIYCKKCEEEGKSWFTGNTDPGRHPDISEMSGWYPVPEAQLPVVLPKDVDFRPTGESPIARSKEFQKGAMCPGCGAKALREVDTMDTYVDSSWYFIRFADPKNDKEFASKEAIGEWLPVDIYVGGGHVVQHLLFARFFWKVLFDTGLLGESVRDEPFIKLRAPGWILGSDFRKMSKRWNNVITPDDIIPKYGADTLRTYEMFMGPFDAMKPWNLTGVEGMWRFVNRVWRLVTENKGAGLVNEEGVKKVITARHKTIQRVTNDIEKLHFNTAIASLMEFVNLLQDNVEKEAEVAEKCDGRAEWEESIKTLLLLLSPFAPHMMEELWSQMPDKNNLKSESVHFQPWPTYDPELVKEEIISVPVQVNGKLRAILKIDADNAQDQVVVESEAKGVESVNKYLVGGEIKKVVFIPSRLINFVTSKNP